LSTSVSGPFPCPSCLCLPLRASFWIMVQTTCQRLYENWVFFQTSRLAVRARNLIRRMNDQVHATQTTTIVTSRHCCMATHAISNSRGVVRRGKQGQVRMALKQVKAQSSSQFCSILFLCDLCVFASKCEALAKNPLLTRRVPILMNNYRGSMTSRPGKRLKSASWV
jgi:hypothetical protein